MLYKYSKIALLTILFLFPVICSANIEITEIMYDLPGSDAPAGQGNREWVEIYNSGEGAIDLIGGTKGWKFNDGSNHGLNPVSGGDLILASQQYAVLVDNVNSFLIDHANFNGKIVDTVMSLKNTSTTLNVLDPDGNLIDNVFYSADLGAAGNGKTLEKTSQGQWQESAIDGGTPGTANGLPQTADSRPQTANSKRLPTPRNRRSSTRNPQLLTRQLTKPNIRNIPIKYILTNLFPTP